ncbi:MAG: hypothetical protein WAM26_01000, partial [Nitrososphaeraceae archaeon]
IISDKNSDANLGDYIHRKSLMIQNGEQLETPEWIIKYIAHVKNPNYIPKISDEARSIVEQFAEALMKNNKDVSPRRLETIFNLTIAHAKVKLKDDADAQDAKEAIEFFKQVNEELLAQIDVQVIDPRDMTLLKLGELLEASSNFGPLVYADLVKSACDQDRQIASYIGSNFSMASNHKMRQLPELLEQRPHVKRVSKKPLMFQWIPDTPTVPTSAEPNSNLGR